MSLRRKRVIDCQDELLSRDSVQFFLMVPMGYCVYTSPFEDMLVHSMIFAESEEYNVNRLEQFVS